MSKNNAEIQAKQLKQQATKPLVRPGLTEEEIEEVRHTFELFDTKKTGFINSFDLLQAMEKLQYRELNPTVYQIALELKEKG